MMNHICLLIILLYLVTVDVFAKCEIKNINEFYKRIQEQGIVKVRSELKNEYYKGLIQKAQERPNPEIEIEYSKAKDQGENDQSFSLYGKHVVELGNKRDRRINKAKVETDILKEYNEKDSISNKLNLLKQFHENSQLSIVIESIKEAIGVFENIINKLSSRSQLNHEETVSLSTLKLAKDDYLSKLNLLENQRDTQNIALMYMSSCENVETIYKELKYGQFFMKEGHDSSKGELNIANLKYELSKSEFELEKSLGYSNLNIGPKFEFSKNGDQDIYSAGLFVSFDLPLFSTNEGGKFLASKKMLIEKNEKDNSINFVRMKKINFYRQYKRAINTLNRLPTLESLEKTHLKIEKLYARGVVSIPMTIESHRQHIDFLKSRFDIENALIESIIQISIIEGDEQSFASIL